MEELSFYISIVVVAFFATTASISRIGCVNPMIQFHLAVIGFISDKYTLLGSFYRIAFFLNNFFEDIDLCC